MWNTTAAKLLLVDTLPNQLCELLLFMDIYLYCTQYQPCEFLLGDTQLTQLLKFLFGDTQLTQLCEFLFGDTQLTQLCELLFVDTQLTQTRVQQSEHSPNTNFGKRSQALGLLNSPQLCEFLFVDTRLTQFCELLFVDTHLLFFLDLQKPALHFVPSHVCQISLQLESHYISYTEPSTFTEQEATQNNQPFFHVCIFKDILNPFQKSNLFVHTF